MSRLWAKGGSRGFGTGAISDYWQTHLIKNRRRPGDPTPWLPGDYVLLDIDENGVYGNGINVLDRELAFVKTERWLCKDKRQPNRTRLKRWYDFVIMKQKRRRGRGPGWRVVSGTWAGFGRYGGLRRYEWQFQYMGKRWYGHRVAVHAMTGLPLRPAARWRRKRSRPWTKAPGVSAASGGTAGAGGSCRGCPCPPPPPYPPHR